MVPTTAGSGTSIKLIEALAMGKFIVASPSAVASFGDIEGIDEAVTVAHSADEFANAMTAMAAGKDTLNEVGRAFYVRNFSNARYVAALCEIVSGLRSADADTSRGNVAASAIQTTD
jgi:hypothetical protein